MNLLLDTCTFLWLVREPERLSQVACAALADPANARYLSAVTYWEIAQKIRVEKLAFKIDVGEVFARARRDLRLATIPVMPEEALLLTDLPLLH